MGISGNFRDDMEIAAGTLQALTVMNQAGATRTKAGCRAMASLASTLEITLNDLIAILGIID